MTKKILATALCSAVLLSSCGGGNTDSTGGTGSTGSTDSKASTASTGSTAGGDADLYSEPGAFPIVKKPIELKLFMSQSANIIDFETNEASLYFEEKSGITLNFETAPSDALKEKINLKLSAGDYPDMFFGTGNIDEARYGVEEGILIDLTDLISTKMPELQQMIKNHPEIEGTITATDGKKYFLPVYNDCYHCTFSNKMWVNTAQLEKMGEKVPTTIDEFYAVCKKFKDLSPTNIPVAGYMNGWNSDVMPFISNSYTYTGLDIYGFRLKDGKIDTVFMTDEYRESLKFLNKMYKEGLLYEASYTMDTPQMKSLLMEAGEPVLFYPAGASVNMIDSGASAELYSHYYPVAPLKGPNGAQYATHIPTYAGLSTAITTACKYPEAAVRLADMMYNLEVGFHLGMGNEGTDWSKPDAGAVGLNGQPALVKRLRVYSQEPQNTNWQDVNVFYAPPDRRLGEQSDPNVDIFSVVGLEAMLYKTTKELYEPYAPKDFAPLPPVKFLSTESQALQTISVEAEKQFKDMKVQFITGAADINDDAAWNSYLKGLTDVGVPKMIETYQLAYDRQFK